MKHPAGHSGGATEGANCRGDALRFLVREPVGRVREPFDRQLIDKFIESFEQPHRQRAVGLAPQHERRHADAELRRVEPWQRAPPGSGGCSGDAR